jgi:orotidine-5'-phosphate decarboxylase
MVVERKKELSVDQKTVARVVASRLGLDVKTVEAIVEFEQRTTMEFIKRGYRVVKKNYMTLIPKTKPEYSFTSGIDGKMYDVPSTTRISVRIGEGFKSFVRENNSMADKLCRFVANKKNPD